MSEKKVKVVLDFSNNTVDGRKLEELMVAAHEQLELKITVVAAEIEKKLKAMKLENASILKTELEITVKE